jgi:hypothetical protein
MSGRVQHVDTLASATFSDTPCDTVPASVRSATFCVRRDGEAVLPPDAPSAYLTCQTTALSKLCPCAVARADLSSPIPSWRIWHATQ